MSGTTWALRPLPSARPDEGLVWEFELATAADLTAGRRHLRDRVLGERLATDDDVDRLLLAFEELASNGLRHGRSPVQVTVSTTATGWLVDVSDTAVDRAPTPAVDRDPALGGMGLHLVARLCGAHGWSVQRDRKHVWGTVLRGAAA